MSIIWDIIEIITETIEITPICFLWENPSLSKSLCFREISYVFFLAYGLVVAEEPS